jgi:hypothetical protein
LPKTQRASAIALFNKYKLLFAGLSRWARLDRTNDLAACEAAPLSPTGNASLT